MTVSSQEHYQLMVQFELDYKLNKPEKEPKQLWKCGFFYCDGETNLKFTAYRQGYAYAECKLRMES